MIPLSFYLTLSAMLFAIGASGVVMRRNAIVVFMCIELMLNAVNISFAAFSVARGNVDGQIAVFFVMVVAAAEAAVGLGIILGLFRARKSIETGSAVDLRL
jgi:NADH-quinone oxidoreductase subunit K